MSPADLGSSKIWERRERREERGGEQSDTTTNEREFEFRNGTD
jgi:hypothetical protein